MFDKEEFMDECIAGVPREQVPWLWPGRIPRGMITIIGGIPGEGKSFLTLDIAARVSTGRSWPDGTAAPCGNVLLLSAEDVAKFTIGPRLDGMEADSRRIFRLSLIHRRGHRGRLFDLTHDLTLLEDRIVIREALAVIIDPITPYLGKCDSFKDAEVRTALAPLAELAERLNIAIIVVMHLTKERNRPAVHRFSGSGGFAAAPRAAFVVARDPSDRNRRLFMPAKTSLVADQPTLAFRLEQHRLVWEPDPLDLDPDEVLLGSEERRAERSILDDGKHFLRTELAQGPVLGSTLKTKFLKLGSPRTLERAKAALGVASLHDGATGRWSWAFPTAHFSSAALPVSSSNNSQNGKASNGGLVGGLGPVADLNVFDLGCGDGKKAKAATPPGSIGRRINWDDVKEDDNA